MGVCKGQLNSEAIFLGFNSSKKRTKYLQNFALATRAEVFRLFFGRTEDKKNCFWDYLTFKNYALENLVIFDPFFLFSYRDNIVYGL